MKATTWHTPNGIGKVPCIHMQLQRPTCCRYGVWMTRATASRQPHTGHTSTSDLAEWITNNGGVVQGVQLHTDAVEGRVLRATQDLPADKTLVVLPSVLCLRYDLVTDARLIKLFGKVPTGSDSKGAAWQFKQALTLLWHQSQGASSPVAHYLPHLPGAAPGVGVPDVGMLLPDDVVEELQDVQIIQDIMNHKYWWDYFSEELKALTDTPDWPFGNMIVDMHTVGDAVAVVISRCFGLKKLGITVMPPLIDMANHTLANHPQLPSPNCEVRSDPDTGSVTMSSTQTIPKGAQLLLQYGRHSNAELVLSYGFALPNNPNDKFLWTWNLDVLVEIIQSMCGANWVLIPTPAWQLNLLKNLHLPVNSDDGGDTVVVSVCGGDAAPVDGRLLGAVRVLLCDVAGRQGLEAVGEGGLMDWNRPVEYEVKVMKALSSLVTAIYQSFPTTIQQDRTMLQSLQQVAAPAEKGITDTTTLRRLAMAVTFRLSLKLALEGALKTILIRGKAGGGMRQFYRR